MEQDKKLTEKEALAIYPFFNISGATRRGSGTYPGRPHSVAVNIPTDPWEIENLKIEYETVIQGLTHREAMAWCRARDVSWSTFLMRKYGHRAPRLEEVIATVNWGKNGKPMKLVKRKLSCASFLGGALSLE